MKIRLLTAALLASASFAGVALAGSPSVKIHQAVARASAGKPTYGRFGFDEAGMDRAVLPGDNFYDFANGGWMRSAEIPADKASYGMFNKLQDLSLERTRGILDEAARRPDSKIGNFYASFMDVAAANAKGIGPIQPWLAEIGAAADKSTFAAVMAKLQRQGVGGLIGFGVGQDAKEPTVYAIQVGQSGLGLPDRDFYLKDDPKLATIRQAYQLYLTNMLSMMGQDNAGPRAAAVMALETRIAKAHWSRIESRDADKTYNKWSFADFSARAPGFPWEVYARAAGMPANVGYIVRQPSAITAEAQIYAQAPLPVLQDLLRLRLIRSYAPFLSDRISDANFAFYGTVLSGIPQQQDRWKRGVGATEGALGEEVGKVYVARYFPPASKAAADQLVKNIVSAMGERIRQLDWMAPETKQKALVKLASFTPKIGYPSKWRDYSALQVQRNDLVGNVARANAFEYDRNMRKLGGPIDRTEWAMTPMTINAYANPVMNEIVFPAAILQPPFFDPNADPAVNYGGIGAVIGHELSHHFDDQGRKYDATGRLTDWWTPQDVARFKSFTDKLVAQYDAYEPIPGQHIQGGLTLGENIADLAGLTVSMDAYHKSLGGRTAPVVDGLTGDQRFYLGWAQVWRIKYREPALRSQLLTDPHSPGAFRTETVRNLDPWYSAFKVHPGEQLYLAPAERVRIW